MAAGLRPTDMADKELCRHIAAVVVAAKAAPAAVA